MKIPYIKKKRREELNDAIIALAALIDRKEAVAGELNYAMSMLLVLTNDKGDYASHNTVLGVLDAVGKEYYRRKVIPYEEEKRTQNGDVWCYDD